MPINSASIPALRVARAIRRRKRAEGGAVGADPFYDPSIDLPSVGDPVVADRPLSAGTRIGNRLFGTGGEERVQTWPETTARRGVGIAGNLWAGAQQMLQPGLRREDFTDIPPPQEHGPNTEPGIFGNTLFKPQARQPGDDVMEQAQDMAGLAGGSMMFGRTAPGASAAAAGRDFRLLGRQLLSDSAAPGAPVAALEHAPKFYSGLEREIGALPDQTMTGAEWASRLWEPPSKKTVGVRDEKNRVVKDAIGHPVIKEVEVQGRSPLPGVKQEELEHSGTLDFLKQNADRPLTKQEVLDHVGANKVELGEVHRGEMKFDKDSPYALPQVVKAARMAGENPGELELVLANDGDAYRALTKKFPELAEKEDWAEIVSKSVFGGDTMPAGSTKYHDYQLPGGDSYREKLLTLPQKKPRASDTISAEMQAKYGREDWLRVASPEDRARWYAEGYKNQGADDTAAGTYRSSHWDEPNVLVHRRTNERDVGAGDGLQLTNLTSGNKSPIFNTPEEMNRWYEGLPESEKRADFDQNSVPRKPSRSLHIEEIQSDWHQQGRKNGYRERDVEAAIGRLRENKATDADVALLQDRVPHSTREYMDNRLPDAPFKKNWHELALKDAIREAAEKGLDRISWTPGEAQAARYDLSKSFDSIRSYTNPDGTYRVWGRPQGGQVHNFGDKIPADKLPDFVGKDLAEKIVKQKPEMENAYSGLDLKVGGEGMKGFYDKIIPDALNKIGKPHGVKVESGALPTPEHRFSVLDHRSEELRQFKSRHEAERWLAEQNSYVQDKWRVAEKTGHPVHYMDIPQSLKDQALKKGFSLFEDSAATGAPLAALEGARGPVAPEPQGGYSASRGATHEPTAAPAAVEPAAASGPGEVGPGGGGPAGGRSLGEAQATAARWAGERQPLEGIPGPLKIGDDHFVPGPIGKIHDVAEDYMRTHRPEIAYAPPTKYHTIDPEHSKAIAKAYEEMKHAPEDAATKASYDALIDETAKQYEAIKKSGLKIEPIPAGAADPYAKNPRLAAIDVAENNHLWFFPTEGGFGSLNKITDNPMLRKTGEKIGDHEMLANDMFRVVHDYFGLLKEGHGFRAAGEDNAWRAHAAMYSDLARPAMTTETRGQNSWLNYGPHGEANRKASAADTVYADQKVGLMPDWTMYDRGHEPIYVYHGSPHREIDRFSSSRIGTGEGNQAYGHGLYMAGAEPVSERYRHALSVMQDPLLKKYKLDDVGHVIGNHLADAGGDAEKLAHEYRKLRNNLIHGGETDKATKNAIVEYDRRIKFLNDPERNRGAMYRAALEADPQHILSYDDAFRQQTPYVQERVGPEMERSIKGQIVALRRMLDRGTYSEGSGRPLLPGKRAQLEGKLQLLEQAGADSLKGSDIYRRVGLPAKDEAEGSVRSAQRLREMGIPAMKYRDASSRGLDASAGPTHNYVVFDDNMLRILRRYGVVGIPAAGVMAAGDGDSMRERKAGGSVNSAMDVARSIRRAKGGKVHLGPIVGDTGGRADKVPMRVPDGAYILTADLVSGLGEGNTDAGMLKLGKMFPKSKPSLMRKLRGHTVPIWAAHGEFCVSPADILDRYGGLDRGHKILDHWQTSERKKLIETLKGLAPPAQD